MDLHMVPSDGFHCLVVSTYPEKSWSSLVGIIVERQQVVERHCSYKFSGWWYTYPSEKYESQLGLLFPIYGKIENVPNHQPEKYIPYPDVNHGAGIFTYKTGQILGHHGASGITNSSQYFYRLFMDHIWYIYMFMDLYLYLVGGFTPETY